MESITIAPGERMDLILRDEARDKTLKKRLRMHIVLLAAEGCSATQIARALFCSRSTIYAIVGSFVREGQKAFEDRKRRGRAPLVESSAQKLIEDLIEEVSPAERGWLRWRWSCKLLVLELFKERALVVSRETVRRVLHKLWVFAGEDPAPSRLPKILNRSEKGSKRS